MNVNQNYYVTNGHFSSTFELYIKNLKSNKKFELKNLNYILKKINVPLYVDNEYQKELKNKLNLNKNEIFKKIKENIECINKNFDAINWTSQIFQINSSLQSKNAKLLDQLIADCFSDYNFNIFPIFFPIYLDFRGRKYYYSRIGPTSSRLIRFCFYYGWYKQEDFSEKNNLYSQNYYYIIDDFCNKYNINNNKKYYETYFWTLIGIGKHFINKNTTPVKLEEFLNKAIKNYNDINKLEIHNYLEAWNYKKIIFEITNEKIKKRTIAKDATASFNQILMKKIRSFRPNFIKLS